jgi:hypothetical protein
MRESATKINPKINAIHDELEKYLEFCREYGYRYDERDLYNWRSYAYQQFNKYAQGKPAKDMWSIDSARRFR